MNRGHAGFTIVELLIVIAVIAILATISVLAYNGVQGRAYDSTVQSDLSRIAKKLEFYNTDNGAYPTYTDVAALTSLGLKISQNSYAVTPQAGRNFIYCSLLNPTDYAFLAKSKSGNGYIIRSSDKTVKPFTDSWTSSTGAGTLCSGIGMSAGNQYAGYCTCANPAWASWTGAS